MAVVPKIYKIEEQKPVVVTVESQKSDDSAKPEIYKTEEQKPPKPSAERE